VPVRVRAALITFTELTLKSSPCTRFYVEYQTSCQVFLVNLIISLAVGSTKVCKIGSKVYYSSNLKKVYNIIEVRHISH
jgi:hypothetical protein